MKLAASLLTPQLWLPWLSLVAIAAALVRVGDQLGASRSHHERCDALRAAIIADDVARGLSAGQAPGRTMPSRVVHEASGEACEIDYRGGDAIAIRISLHGRDHVFAGRLLEGAAPEALSYRAVVGNGAAVDGMVGAVTLPETAMPRPRAGASSSVFPQSVVVPVHGLAPRFLRWGTDRPDFRLRSGGDAQLTLDRVVWCPGHLWIPPGEPVTLRLERDATIIATGNLYLGDDLVVEGPGRLLLMAWADRGEVFGDENGNGTLDDGEPRWRKAEFGHTAAEGQGAVHFGLPGTDRSTPVRLDAAVVAYGEMRAILDASIKGPAVALHGVRGPGIVVGGSGWVMDVARDGFPGLATEGAPRPSLLRPMRGR